MIGLQEHPFLLALHRRGRFARRNVVPPRETSPPIDEERGETDVFAGYIMIRLSESEAEAEG